jgi:threonine dehydrogenase-like Zn-dependent dehydrogenase
MHHPCCLGTFNLHRRQSNIEIVCSRDLNIHVAESKGPFTKQLVVADGPLGMLADMLHQTSGAVVDVGFPPSPETKEADERPFGRYLTVLDVRLDEEASPILDAMQTVDLVVEVDGFAPYGVRLEAAFGALAFVHPRLATVHAICAEIRPHHAMTHPPLAGCEGVFAGSGILG